MLRVKGILSAIFIVALVSWAVMVFGRPVVATVSTYSAEGVEWSEKALIYNSTVLPCMMDNAVAMGMPTTVKDKAMCVTVKGAEGIAAGTDNVVNVTDLRAATAAYVYNHGIMGANNLSVACSVVWKLEVGNGTGLLGQPLTNCLEGTGIAEVNCTELLAWIDENADVINSAMETACSDCDSSWDPERPVPEFSVLAMLVLLVATTVLLAGKRRLRLHTMP